MMSWFFQWIYARHHFSRPADICNESELALVRQLADHLEAQEMVTEKRVDGEDLAC